MSRIVYTSVPRCTICSQTPDVLQAVHGVIWDFPEGATAISSSMRNRDYRLAAIRVLELHEVALEEKAVTRHVEHVERTGRVQVRHSSSAGTRAVFDSSYTSIVDKAANLGMGALAQLEQRIEAGEVKDRELVAMAKLGVSSRVEEQKLELRQQGQSVIAAALFAMAGGFINNAELPAERGLVIDVTPLEASLYDELEAERSDLMAAAGHVRRVLHAGSQALAGDPDPAGRPDGPD